MATGTAVIRDFSGGVRLDKHPRDLAANELAWSRNMYVEDLGGPLVFRPTTVNDGNLDLQVATPGSPSAAIAFWDIRGFKDELGMSWVMLARHIKASDISSLGTVRKIAGYTPDGSGVAETYLKPAGDPHPSWVSWQGRLYYFDGAGDPGVYYTRNLDTPFPTIKLINLASLWSASDLIFPAVVWVHRNQFVFAKITDQDPTFIRNSAINDPHTLVTSSKGFNVGREEGGRVVHGMEIAVEGGDTYFQSYSLIWKEKSTWLLTGDLPTATEAGSVKLVPVLNEGLVSKRSVVKTDKGVVWCSGKNVYLAPISGKPVPIGDALRPLLATKPASANYAWGAAFWEGFYILSIPADVESDLILPVEQWWCDLREFPEKVRWYGPMEISGQPFMLHDVSSNSGLDLPKMGTMADGTVYVANLVKGTHLSSSSTKNNDHNRAQASLPGLGMEIRLKEYDGGDYDLKKILEKVTVAVQVSGSLTLTVQIKTNGGATTSTQSGSETTAGGFVLGTSLLGTGVLAEEYRNSVFYPPNSTRLIANSFQPVVSFAPSGGVSYKLKVRQINIGIRPLSRRSS